MGLIRSLQTYRHGCPTSSTPSFHWDQQNGNAWGSQQTAMGFLIALALLAARTAVSMGDKTEVSHGTIGDDQRSRPSWDMPHRGTQLGVRDNLWNVLARYPEHAKYRYNDTLLWGASTLIQKRELLISWASFSIAEIDRNTGYSRYWRNYPLVHIFKFSIRFILLFMSKLHKLILCNSNL